MILLNPRTQRFQSLPSGYWKDSFSIMTLLISKIIRYQFIFSGVYFYTYIGIGTFNNPQEIAQIRSCPYQSEILCLADTNLKDLMPTEVWLHTEDSSKDFTPTFTGMNSPAFSLNRLTAKLQIHLTSDINSFPFTQKAASNSLPPAVELPQEYI